MTIVAKPLAEQADPFGLWEVKSQGEQAESFALPGEGAPPAEEESQGLVWSLDLHSSIGGVDVAEPLDQRERKVQAIEAGLEQAIIRAERAIAQHKAAARGEAVAFAVDVPPAEFELAAALAEIDPGDAPASYALGLPSVDWNELKRRFDAFMESVNRQALHYAWVETRLDGTLVAQTAVRWGGDLRTYLLPGTGSQVTEAHARSMTLALAARAANLRTTITVMQIAAKIALAVTTPIGVVQALSLAWQFVQEVIVPLLDEARKP